MPEALLRCWPRDRDNTSNRYGMSSPPGRGAHIMVEVNCIRVLVSKVSVEDPGRRTWGGIVPLLAQLAAVLVACRPAMARRDKRLPCGARQR